MRRALWIFSAPVVAGGLAWAVNAADNQSPLLTRAPQAQNGQIFYFSRGGNSGSSSTATYADDGPADSSSDDADAADTPPVPKRYVRTTAATGGAVKPPLKNYKDLFADADDSQDASKLPPLTPPTTSPGAAKAARETAAKRPTKPATPAPSANRQAIIEECGINDSADAKLAREDVQLPAAGKNQQVGGTSSQKAAVRHADHKVADGATNKSVRPAQYSGRTASGKGGPSRSPVVDDTDIAPPDDDDVENAAPVPPPMTKTARTTKPSSATKAAPAKPVRTSAGNKTSSNPPARTAVRLPPAAGNKPKSKISPAVAEEEAPLDVSPAVTATATSTADVPMVSLRWTKNEEVNVGQECTCGLVVKNTGKLAAKDIVVEAYFPRTVRLIDADPFPNDSKDHLVWNFEHLEPGQEKTIDITMIPGRRGELATSATVRFTGVASTVLTVEEPQLSVSINGTKEVMVGDSLTQIITVSNPGTGIAHDVVVHAQLSEGLEHPRGKMVEMGIGSLGPGESRELRLPLSATTGGDAMIVVEARGSANLAHRAECSIKVAAPKLSIEVAGPGLRYVGRHAQYVLTVTNDGIATTDNVRVVELVPEGFEFIKADKGGKFDASSGSVCWFVGRLEAGQSVQVAVDLNSKQIGEYLHHVQASGENGIMAKSKMTTRVEGTAAIVMEVADLDDPVEVGTQTAYEIRIRNDGSKAAQNLKVACELPPGVELIDTKGPTELASEKGVLHFKPISEIAAGSKMTYLIRVNGRVAGNLRMRAKLTSNASSEPLVVEEMTKFYAD